MKLPKRWVLRVTILVLVSGGGWGIAADAGHGGDVAVVVHPSVPTNGLELQQMRRLLLGERQFWKRDLKVTLLIRAPKARERDVVLKRIYRMNEAQFRRYWIGKVFRAEAPVGPKIVYSTEMATQLTLAIPGALTFVAGDSVPPGLKVLAIDGKLPGEPGYPLQ